MKALVTAAVAAGVIFALSGDKVAAQDAAKGEIVFKTCMACHRIGPKATNLVGPVLNDLVGRQAGTVPAFRYSALNKHAGENGLVWNDDQIFEYLADPNAFLKKFLTGKGGSRGRRHLDADQAAGRTAAQGRDRLHQDILDSKIGPRRLFSASNAA
jgi:cytochrome c